MPSEKFVQNRVLLLSSADVRLFRNNCGVARYPTESGKDMRVKYGVGQPGGSDIIGIRAIRRGGVKVGQFVAIEVKADGNKPNLEQSQFLQVIQGLGGLAAVVRSEEEAKLLLQDDG